MLSIRDSLPDSLLRCDASGLQAVLGGPTLIELEGARKRPLFVSVLLHGNETSGWQAMQSLLTRYVGRTLPRSLSFFIGNTTAAAKAMRCLPGQADYNRVWPGEETDSREGNDAEAVPEARMMREIVERLREQQVFASIDVHNNTGCNPFYACVNRLEAEYLSMARGFAPMVVYFIRPEGVQSLAMAELCPAVTLEAGKPGQGVEEVADYVESLLLMDDAGPGAGEIADIDLFHTVATVTVPREIKFGFGAGHHALSLPNDLDGLNFVEQQAGTVFGSVRNGVGYGILVRDEAGEDVTAEFFKVVDGMLENRKPVMPSMLTLEPEIIRQDCLCYLMERIPLGELAL